MKMQKLYLFVNFKTYIATAKTPISVVQTKTFKATLTMQINITNM